MAHRENENARANGGSRAEGFNLSKRSQVLYDACLASLCIPDAKRIGVVMEAVATVTEASATWNHRRASNRPGKRHYPRHPRHDDLAVGVDHGSAVLVRVVAVVALGV